jgi:hypothetical protein
MATRIGARRGLSVWSKVSGTNTKSLAKPLLPDKDTFITPSEFNHRYLKEARPGFFPGLIGDPASPYRWPAYIEWPNKTSRDGGLMDGLRRIPELQQCLVDVEISPQGRGYGDGVQMGKENGDESDWMKVTMPFELFLDAFIDGKIPWKNGDKSDSTIVGYLAQQDLFEKSDTLSRQCPNLPHTTAGTRGNHEQWRRNVWIGGKGSFTPIHCDPYKNVFVQVVGSKRAHIFPPSVAPHLHLFPPSTTQPNTSSIPTEDVLLVGSLPIWQAKYPDVAIALSHPDTHHVTLEAGDALYIPQGWFHCLSSTSISASVNAWFR